MLIDHNFTNLILVWIQLLNAKDKQEYDRLRKALIMIKDLWKGLLVVIIGVAVSASSFLVPFHSFLPAWIHLDDSYIIKTREYRSLSIDLMFGCIVRGMLDVSGGDGYISFSVEDSGGRIIIPERRVGKRHFFEFQPAKTDSYVLVLDNSGYSAEKSVYWIVWVYYYNILFLFLGIILFIAGISAVLREQKKLSREIAQTLEEARKIVEESWREASYHSVAAF